MKELFNLTNIVKLFKHQVIIFISVHNMHRKQQSSVTKIQVTQMLTLIYFANFGSYSEGIFGNHLTAHGNQNVKFCNILEIWKKLKMVPFS